MEQQSLHGHSQRERQSLEVLELRLAQPELILADTARVDLADPGQLQLAQARLKSECTEIKRQGLMQLFHKSSLTERG